mmetsp:Transcript_48981/g.115475  ORF Transcript_48981/g.115475 Transcript_48981/m.115475 type:complete len:435 (+) Transcript_48981:188-1492(+)
MSVSASDKEEAERLEREGKELEARLQNLRRRVEQGRRSVEEAARDGGVATLKHGGDLLFLPRETISAVFRVDNVSVRVSVKGQRQKERTEASMGIRVGTAAEEHLEKIKLRDELHDINSRESSRRGSFTLDAAGLGFDLNREDQAFSENPSPKASTQQSVLPLEASPSPTPTQQIENHFSSFVFLKPRLPGVPKMNQIIIKLIPKIPSAPAPKNSIVPKSIISDPAWYHFLSGLQHVDGEQAYPQLNPETELVFLSPSPRAVSAEWSEEEDEERRGARQHQSEFMAHVSTQNTGLMSQVTTQNGGSELPFADRRELVRITHALLSRKDALESLDIASKGEVEDLRKEVANMRSDVDRMLQVLSKIHREMVTRKAAGPPTPFGNFKTPGAASGPGSGPSSPLPRRAGAPLAPPSSPMSNPSSRPPSEGIPQITVS